MDETIANYLALIFWELGREDLAEEILDLVIEP